MSSGTITSTDTGSAFESVLIRSIARRSASARSIQPLSRSACKYRAQDFRELAAFVGDLEMVEAQVSGVKPCA